MIGQLIASQSFAIPIAQFFAAKDLMILSILSTYLNLTVVGFQTISKNFQNECL